MRLPNPFRSSRRGRDLSASGAPALAGVGSRYMLERYTGPPYGGSGNGVSPFWQPYLREPQADTQEAWLAATAETIQAMHTSGNMAGAIKSARGQVMFENGLRPNLKPWGGMISSDPKIQAAWARDTEGRFMLWANNPWNVDLGGRHTLGVLLAQLLDQRFGTGEMIATLPHIERPGSSHGLKVNVMPSQRLSQIGGINTVQGVTMDPEQGYPVAYNFNHYNIASHAIEQRTIAARDGEGRQTVVHVFDNAPGTVRGITPFAPVLRVLHASDQLGTGQLVLSMMQNIFAATVESPLPSAEILMALMGLDEQDGDEEQAEELSRRMATIGDTGQKVVQGSFMDLLTARTKWYSSTNIDLGKFGKIAHLFPGEKLTFNRPNAPSADYVAFQKFLHYECARAMGIAAFQWNGIFDGYTYTTAKMAIDEAWPMTLWNRQMVARIAQAVFMAWLEEDIILGNTQLPGGLAQFQQARDAVCRCDWIGPPRATADDLKTAKAMQVMRAEGWQSSASIASGYGFDWTEEADDQAEFNAYRKEKDLDPPPSLGGGGNGAGSAAVAGVRGQGDDVDAQTDREARLVGAMIRGDDASVEACLMENENDRGHFVRFAARAAADWGYRAAA